MYLNEERARDLLERDGLDALVVRALQRLHT